MQENAFGHLPEFPLSPEHDAERQNFAQVWKNWDGSEGLKKTHVPVLEIWGDRNRSPVPDRATMQIPDRKNIEMAWIHNASHALLVEQPER